MTELPVRDLIWDTLRDSGMRADEAAALTGFGLALHLTLRSPEFMGRLGRAAAAEMRTHSSIDNEGEAVDDMLRVLQELAESRGIAL